MNAQSEIVAREPTPLPRPQTGFVGERASSDNSVEQHSTHSTQQYATRQSTRRRHLSSLSLMASHISEL